MTSQHRDPTWKEVIALDAPGRHRVGQNLYLQITRTGARSYLFRYKMAGHGQKQREMGLGAFRDIGLSEAREEVQTLRRLIRQGIDPIDHRRQKREAARRADQAAITFKEAAEKYLEDNADAWKNEKHQLQWRNTLSTYAFPIIGHVGIGNVDTNHVLEVLRPIWREKTETASRLRGRIETVLDWAKAHGMRQGENPARWRGHLSNVLPSRASLKKVQHHPALPYPEMPAFIADLRKREGMSALALEFLILTAARSGEVRGARWDEFELGNGTWTVPEDRMKAGREHRVPLSPRAIELVTSLREFRTGHFVFPAPRGGQFSDAALGALLKRMKRDTITVHGFRSSFRDWAAEQTSFPPEIAERALAHVNRDKVEAAYQRSDLFEKRRKLMETWARFCEGDAKKLRLLG